MRMWLINPKIMCNRHLLGEHVEMHMFIGSINKGKSLDGYILNGELDISKIEKRHEELEQEMLLRGMKHHSPLEEFSINKINFLGNLIDVDKNLKELLSRCKDCKRRYGESKLVIIE